MQGPIEKPGNKITQYTTKFVIRKLIPSILQVRPDISFLAQIFFTSRGHFDWTRNEYENWYEANFTLGQEKPDYPAKSAMIPTPLCYKSCFTN